VPALPAFRFRPMSDWRHTRVLSAYRKASENHFKWSAASAPFLHKYKPYQYSIIDPEGLNVNEFIQFLHKNFQHPAQKSGDMKEINSQIGFLA